MYQSTLTHLDHKSNKEIYMEALSKKIAELSKEDYDKKIYSSDEIGKKISPEASRNLKHCEEFNIPGFAITASEIIHSKDALEALQKEKPSFREQGKNDEKISELKELISELQSLLVEKGSLATRMKAHKAKEDKHAKALAELEPLADELEALEKKIKDNLPNIRTLEGNRNILANPINPDIFRLLNSIAGGLN